MMQRVFLGADVKIFSDLYIPKTIGRLTSLAFTLAVIAMQAAIVFNFYQHKSWEEYDLFCAEMITGHLSIICTLSWWRMFLGLFCYSILNYRKMGHKWWLIVLPISVIFLTVLSCTGIPYTFSEHVIPFSDQ
jgi:hypothetical protein